MRLAIATVTICVASWCCLAQESDSTNRDKQVDTSSKKTSDEEQPIKLDPKGEALPPSIWMQQKLKHSQNIFKGMVKGDLMLVEESARHLSVLHRLESFVRRDSKDYRAQMTLFEHANNEILKGAQAKNLDRVTLGYNQMTVSCVACHKHLRDDD